MNGCSAIQKKFTEYLDDRLNGREMQRIAAHLESCRECAREWAWLRHVQASLAALGPAPEPSESPSNWRARAPAATSPSPDSRLASPPLPRR